MNIVLPDEVLPLLERQARQAGIATVEEYVFRAVLQADPDQLGAVDLDAWVRSCLAEEKGTAVAAEEVERHKSIIAAQLIEGLQSGPAVAVTPQFWAERRRMLEERMGRRSGVHDA
jgi:hypothetical protein